MNQPPLRPLVPECKPERGGRERGEGVFPLLLHTQRKPLYSWLMILPLCRSGIQFPLLNFFFLSREYTCLFWVVPCRTRYHPPRRTPFAFRPNHDHDHEPRQRPTETLFRGGEESCRKGQKGHSYPHWREGRSVAQRKAIAETRTGDTDSPFLVPHTRRTGVFERLLSSIIGRTRFLDYRRIQQYARPRPPWTRQSVTVGVEL